MLLSPPALDVRLLTALQVLPKCFSACTNHQHLRSTNCQRPLHCTGRGTNGAQTQGYKHGEARSDAGESRRRWRVLRRRELHFTFSKFSVQSVASHERGLYFKNSFHSLSRLGSTKPRQTSASSRAAPSRLSKRSSSHAARDQVRPSRISHHLDRPLASRAGSGKSDRCDCGDHSAALRMSLPTSTASAAGCRLAGLREGAEPSALRAGAKSRGPGRRRAGAAAAARIRL